MHTILILQRELYTEKHPESPMSAGAGQRNSGLRHTLTKVNDHERTR
jgi:hypothetical protein